MQPKKGDVKIVAKGRSDWIGWVELTTEPVDELAIHMTARVIDDVGADVLAVVEAESRPSLVRFNDEMLNGRYAHVMLIDGNDRRGIDVGLLTGAAVEMTSVACHVDDPDPGRPGETLFSRDCPVHPLKVGNLELWGAREPPQEPVVHVRKPGPAADTAGRAGSDNLRRAASGRRRTRRRRG